MTACGDAITASTVAAYLALYTGYDAAKKEYTTSKIVQVLTMSAGWRFTVSELNKIFALAGLTLVSASLALKQAPESWTSVGGSLACLGSAEGKAALARVLCGGTTLARLDFAR